MAKPAFLSRLLTDETGTSAVEYGLICAMIILAMLSALTGMGNMVQQTWGTVSTQTAQAVSQSTGS